MENYDLNLYKGFFMEKNDPNSQNFERFFFPFSKSPDFYDKFQ